MTGESLENIMFVTNDSDFRLPINILKDGGYKVFFRESTCKNRFCKPLWISCISVERHDAI